MDTLVTQPITAQELIEHGWDSQLANLVVNDPKAAIFYLIEQHGWDRLDAITRVLNPIAPFDQLVGRKRPPFAPEVQALIDRSLAQLGIELVGENGVLFAPTGTGGHTPVEPVR